jgi:hypothetical protein
MYMKPLYGFDNISFGSEHKVWRTYVPVRHYRLISQREARGGPIVKSH